MLSAPPAELNGVHRTARPNSSVARRDAYPVNDDPAPEDSGGSGAMRLAVGLS